MKGSSSTTRRYRGVASPHKLPLSGVQHGTDDDYNDEERVKKRRTKRHLVPLVFLQQALNAVKPDIRQKFVARSALVVFATLVALLLVQWRSRPVRWRRLRTHRSVRASVRRRLDHLTHIFPSFFSKEGQIATAFPEPLDAFSLEDFSGRDYGGLKIELFEPSACPKEGCRRQIFHQPVTNSISESSDSEAENYDNYYAFDDDRLRNPYVRYSKDEEDLAKRCRRVSWHRFNPINCNVVHELDFRSLSERGDMLFVGEGAFRQVFLTDLGSEMFAFKKFAEEAEYDYQDFEYMRMDSIVAERLSSREEIVSIYAFCGLSNLNEAMLQGDLEKRAQPHGFRAPEVELNDKEQLDPKNNFLPSQKLLYSLEMAEAVSLLHSYPGGVIVHDDIQMSQFLFTPDLHLKLNDFNRAEIMLFNEHENDYCRYSNNPGRGDWRAPEEYHDDPLNEKIDVYSLGNNMYALLTGVSVFYDEEDIDQVQRRVKSGEMPYIDPRWQERSFAERKMIEIMEKMWTYDPDERVDIFEVITFLREAYEETRRNHMHEDELVGAQIREASSDSA